MRKTTSCRLVKMLLPGILAIGLCAQAAGVGVIAAWSSEPLIMPAADEPGLAIDLYGGAKNNGYGFGYPGPFPAPFGGQGIDHRMDIVFPKSEVALYASVAHNCVPMSGISISFDAEGPYDEFPNGTVFKKPTWRWWASLLEQTNSTGIAELIYLMPWPDLNPDEITGLWRVTATAATVNGTIRDTMAFYYQWPIYIDSVSTDKPCYIYGEYIQLTVRYKTHSVQTYEAFFTVDLTDVSGSSFGNSVTPQLFGEATSNTWKLSQFTNSHLVNYSVHAGYGRVLVKCSDKETPIEGASMCSGYLPQGIFIAHAIVPDQAPKIQVAIDRASEGHAIYVRSGVYREHIIIGRELSLIGENQETTIIDEDNTGNAVKVNATNVTISGFQIRNAACGLYLQNCNDTRIENMRFLNNTKSIFLEGCRFAKIFDNRIENMAEHALHLSNSHSNAIRRNAISRANGCGVYLSSSSNNTIESNVVSNGTIGIGDGLKLENSHGNLIMNNTISHNGGIAISLGASNKSLIFHNNFVANAVQMQLQDSYDNQWNHTCEGNYWSDYTGSDTNGDGIGDEYLPWEGIDYYPLMNRYWNPGDINHDLKVDLKDVYAIGRAYGSSLGQQNWNPYCDVNLDGKIDLKDYYVATKNYGRACAVVYVAASDLPAEQKSKADYVCDGTSDEDEINAALATDKIVHLLKGNFTIDGEINGFLANSVLEGEGERTTIRLRNGHGASINMVYISAVDYVTIRSLKVDGNRANQNTGTINCIRLQAANYATILTCTVVGARTSAISVQSSTKCVARNNIVKDSASGIVLNNSTENLLEQNVCSGHGTSTGSGIRMDNCSHKNKIIGNVASIYRNGLYSGNSNENVYLGNTVRQCTDGINMCQGSSRSTVDDNIVEDCTNIGIWIDTNDHCIVENNRVYESGADGIQLLRSKYCTVKGNTLKNNGQRADNTYAEIHLKDDGTTYATHNIVSGNTILCDASTNRSKWCIQEDSANDDYNTITDNICKGARQAEQISKLGAHSIESNNVKMT